MSNYDPIESAKAAVREVLKPLLNLRIDGKIVVRESAKKPFTTLDKPILLNLFIPHCGSEEDIAYYLTYYPDEAVIGFECPLGRGLPEQRTTHQAANELLELVILERLARYAPAEDVSLALSLLLERHNARG